MSLSIINTALVSMWSYKKGMAFELLARKTNIAIEFHRSPSRARIYIDSRLLFVQTIYIVIECNEEF